MTGESTLASRRAFLHFLASSPALCAAGSVMGQSLSDPYAPQVISKASDAINVFDFHEVAKQTFMPGHYTFMSLGTDDGGTLRANREGFKKIQLRMRRLVDVRNVDTSIELFGRRYPLPILIAPCSSQKAFHPEGEVATARAAKSKGVEQILSTASSTAIEEVNAARGRPIWYQLYPSSNWQATRTLVKRVEAAGCSVLALTVDHPVSNREVLYRHRRDTNPDCQVCHGDANVVRPSPMIDGIEQWQWGNSFMDWDFVDRLKDFTSMKLVLKGIVTAE